MVKKLLCFLLGTALFVGASAGVYLFLSPRLPRQEEELVRYTRLPQETVVTVPEPELDIVVEVTETTLTPEPVPTEAEETQPTYPRQTYQQVPLYNQVEYPHIRYGTGTVATSGSNIVSLAMVASYLTGYAYQPDELADWFASYVGNSMQWLEYASDQLQLPWEKAENIDMTLRSVKEGKVAVVLMREKSIFRETAHYVVFTGVNAEGKVLINDPYGPNYEAWHLKNALVTGFRRGDLSGGYAGAWVYDPGAVSEVPFHYEAPENTDTFRYTGMELTPEEVTLIASLVWAEAASEPFEGQQAVAEVILNRMKSPQFPDTVQGIIYAEGQFQAAGRLYLAELTHIQYEAVERALYGPYVLPEDVVFFSQWPVNDRVWGKIGKHTFCHSWQ